MPVILQRVLSVIGEFCKRAAYAVLDLFRRSSRMMSISRRTLLTLSAFLTIWYSALQVKGACGALTPMQCLVTPLSWVSPKLFGRLEEWARPAPKVDSLTAVVKPPAAPPTPAPADKSNTKVVNVPPAKPPSPPQPEAKRPPGPSVAPQRQRMFTVVNRGNQAVASFWASACNDNSWGPDRLGKNTLARNYQQHFNLADGTGNCCFDLRVRFDNGQQNTARSMDVCQVTSWTVSNDW